MKRELNIMGKVYEVQTSAYTPFLYKKVFKSGFLSDIQKLSEIKIEDDKVVGNIDDFFEVILQVAYILILGANKNFMAFDEWVSSHESLNMSDTWVAEVTELAVTSFLGQGTNGTTTTDKEKEQEERKQ